MMPGTRKAASKPVPFSPRNGLVPASGQASCYAPLSEVGQVFQGNLRAVVALDRRLAGRAFPFVKVHDSPVHVPETPAAAQKKPNIVILMSDDVGWGDYAPNV
jgi:hypothetical protein